MNISLILNIFISVFSGVLSAGFLYAFGLYFNKIIIPWYRNLKYKGLDISGKWVENHNYENILTQESEIIINQSTDKVEGSIIIVKKYISSKEVFEIKNFNFKGEFNNNFLNITCWNSDKKQIGTTNYLLLIKMDGRGLEGMKTYYDIGFQKIKSVEISWLRKNEKN